MLVENTVKERYAEGATSVQADLCCPVDYDRSLLKLLPQEIIEKDYGCGDPSRYVKEGDTVLDLGSGGGKICYMAAQLVGKQGKVIGVDMTDDMLALSRKYQNEMADKLGGQLVEFKRGYIQDLALDLDAVNEYVAQQPINTLKDLQQLEQWKHQQRQNAPMIADNSIDLVISNCVLNLVAEHEKVKLIAEIFRVLKPGGRVAISDIVSDEDIPMNMKSDPELWSGCISGAFHEKGFLDAFVNAGFIAVAYDKWEAKAWRVVQGIEFRSVTLTAVKPSADACFDKGHAVIYKGPYATISDDEGHVFPRGERMAVCERSYLALTSGIYANDFIGIAPAQEKPPVPYCTDGNQRRLASESKGAHHSSQQLAEVCDSTSGCCC